MKANKTHLGIIDMFYRRLPKYSLLDVNHYFHKLFADKKGFNNQ